MNFFLSRSTLRSNLGTVRFSPEVGEGSEESFEVEYDGPWLQQTSQSLPINPQKYVGR